MEPDFISKLPSELLSFIISKLPINECVRTSVLSEKWKPLWKNTLHMEIHVKSMLIPSSLCQYPFAYLNTVQKLIRENKFHLYSERVCSVLNSHSGDVCSISFVHFCKNLVSGDVQRWIQILSDEESRMEHLILKCEPYDLMVNVRHSPDTTDDFNLSVSIAPRIFSILCSLELTNYFVDNSSPFEGCQKLVTLKLRRMRLDDETLDGILRSCTLLEKFRLVESTGFKKLNIQNPNLQVLELGEMNVDEINVPVEGLQVLNLGYLFCPAKSLLIGARSLRVFRSLVTPDPQMRNLDILTNQDILENCSALFESGTSNIFKNLSTLSIGLDLNNVREAFALSFVINSYVKLQTLEIVLPVCKPSKVKNFSSDDCVLPYPKSKFWEIRGMSNRIIGKLKYVFVIGFEGKEQEVGFVEELIKQLQ